MERLRSTSWMCLCTVGEAELLTKLPRESDIEPAWKRKVLCSKLIRALAGPIRSAVWTSALWTTGTARRSVGTTPRSGHQLIVGVVQTDPVQTDPVQTDPVQGDCSGDVGYRDVAVRVGDRRITWTTRECVLWPVTLPIWDQARAASRSAGAGAHDAQSAESISKPPQERQMKGIMCGTFRSLGARWRLVA